MIASTGAVEPKFNWSLKADTPPSFGNPLSGVSYTACMFAPSVGVDQALAAFRVPSSTDCDSADCWREIGARKVYKAAQPAEDGAAVVRLVERRSGGAFIRMKAAGAVNLPDLPLESPVKVQLIGSDGQCWESTFDSWKVNDERRFRAAY